MKILAAKPTITELEVKYVTDAVRNGWGENCYSYLNKFKSLVSEYLGVDFVCPTSSCHGALHILLMALGIGRDDEVIVPDATWVGSVFPISWLGAKPVFVDILESTWCIDPVKIEEAITPKTKAIIAVHLYGNLCEMDELLAIGAKYGIPVIEDAAEALGSEYKGKKAGSIGDFGVFSFHGTKTLTTGEGGAIVSSRSDNVIEKIGIIESQGRCKGADLFWVDEIGLKYKMSNIDAALGCAQFERADEIVAKKIEVFGWYKEVLGGWDDISLNHEQEYVKNSFWMPTIVFGDSYDVDCKGLIREANEGGIALRPFFYPVSNFPMYDDKLSNKVSYKLSTKGINLPNYYSLTASNIEYVVNCYLKR